MSERRDFTHTVPARPIVLRPHHPELEPQALLEPMRPGSHLTRRRIMYLVGLILQASVLALLVAGFLAYEAPIRVAVGLPASEAPLAASLGGLEADIAVLSARVEALAAAVGTAPPGTGEPATLAERVGRIEAAVTRVEATVDARAALPPP